MSQFIPASAVGRIVELSEFRSDESRTSTSSFPGLLTEKYRVSCLALHTKIELMRVFFVGSQLIEWSVLLWEQKQVGHWSVERKELSE